MQKISTKNWLIPCFFAFLFSCKKSEWFDEKPYKYQVVPQSLSDLQAIMDNSLLFNQFSPALGEVGVDDHYVSDEEFRYLSQEDVNGYTWSQIQPYQNINEWNNANTRGAYPRVYSANLVLELIEKVIPANSIEAEEREYIKGQALFHRGRTFYELSQVFAPAYSLSTSTKDLGIPLRISSEIGTPSSRSTVKDTYSRIVDDLVTSINYIPASILPQSNLYKVRPTRAAVYALLARVYLSMENYEKAKLYSDTSLSLHNILLDYSKLPTVGQPFSILNSEVIWHSTLSTQFLSLITPYMLINNELYNEYSDDDLRKIHFFTKSNSIVNYRGSYAGSTLLFCGLATDELYLIRAECKARLNDLSGALSDLNHLLETRWKKVEGNSTYVNLSISDSEELLKVILKERRKELILRGIRWSDLRRLNRDDRFKVSLYRFTPIGNFELKENSYRYTLPIPDDVIKASGMKQNEGWEN